MDGTINKFDQITAIFAQCSEQNKENLVKVAKSLLKIQNEHEARLDMPVSSPDSGRHV